MIKSLPKRWVIVLEKGIATCSMSTALQTFLKREASHYYNVGITGAFHYDSGTKKTSFREIGAGIIGDMNGVIYTDISLEDWYKLQYRKIVAYKSPYDILDGSIKKGTLFTTWTANSSFYTPKENKDSRYSIPKEIVETWEAVYEEVPEFLFGGKKIEFIERNRIKCDGVTGLVSQVREIYESYYIKRYFGTSCQHQMIEDLSKYTLVKIGCTTGTLGELKAILDAHSKMLQ